MRAERRAILACGLVALALLAGYGRKDDTVSQAEKKDAAAGVARRT